MNQDQVEFLKSLETDGALTPERVVEAAKDENSPIHSLFQWDDEAAGAAYRLWQARQLIVKVRVTIQEGDEEIKVQKYHSLPTVVERSDNQRAYVNIEKILSQEDLTRQLLNECYLELVYWRNKYSSLKQIKNLTKTLDKVEEVLLEPVTLVA